MRNVTLVGDRLRYVVEVDGGWITLLGGVRLSVGTNGFGGRISSGANAMGVACLCAPCGAVGKGAACLQRIGGSGERGLDGAV